MQQIPIDKILMALSVLLTSSENNLQLNSQPTDLSEFYRIGENKVAGASGRRQNLGDQSDVLDNLISNQVQITERARLVALEIQTLYNHLSITDDNSVCFGGNIGETVMKLPNFPDAQFPVQCVSNKYGDNWLLVAYKIPKSDLLNSVSSQNYDEFFIGLAELCAVTDNELHELLIIELSNGVEYYEHYEAIAFNSTYHVKLLGRRRTNRSNFDTILAKQGQILLKNISLRSNANIKMYLRTTTLDDVPQLKGV